MIPLMPAEPIIDPDLPIVDPHHHLWFLPEAAIAAMSLQDNITARALVRIFRQQPRYLFDELRADTGSGHNVHATVFIEARTMYRATGPEPLKSVGEVEFVNGVAAMAASGLFGPAKLCAGIVGNVDLMLGDAVEDVLRAHIHAGAGRYRGVRSSRIAYDQDSTILGPGGVPGRLVDPRFREGFRHLHRHGLSFDVLVLEPQLPELTDLARDFPETQIVVNHLGGPVGVGRYTGRRQDRFPLWRASMRTLADCQNVVVKLGGFGSPLGGFDSFLSNPPATSSQLATEWKPYIETCIELFGVGRCMFESNFPVDATTCTYPVLWNTFKRIAAEASPDEKSALFSGTATRIYRLEP